jgi:hypothetical protein
MVKNKAEYFKQLYHVDKNRFNEFLAKDLARRGVKCDAPNCNNIVARIITENVVRGFSNNRRICYGCYRHKELEEEKIIFQKYCDAEPDEDGLHHNDGYDSYDGIW